MKIKWGKILSISMLIGQHSTLSHYVIMHEDVLDNWIVRQCLNNYGPECSETKIYNAFKRLSKEMLPPVKGACV